MVRVEEGTEGAGRGIWQAGREEEERREEQEEDRVKVKEPHPYCYDTSSEQTPHKMRLVNEW